ncbi:MAG: type II CAAX prenyl endopeptidase Rce1 family protein [Anaerolineae bacterium]
MTTILDWLAFLLLMTLFFAFAASRFVAALRRFADGRHQQVLLALVLLIPFLLAALPGEASNPVSFLHGAGRMLLYLLTPALAMIFRPRAAKALHPLDILATLAIWFPIEFDWLPDVDARLAGGVSIPIPLLTGVVLAFLCFLVLRPLAGGIGYTFRLTRADFGRISAALTAYTLVAIPLGLAVRFLVFGVAPFNLGEWVLAWSLGYLFTALPEEMLFRGIIQNQIHQRLKGEWAALGVAAVIFGLAHLNNATPGYPEPNWMYVLMASLAGLAYGWTWRKTGKITASAVVHATVNFLWGILLSG